MKAKILEMPKSNQQLWDAANKLRPKYNQAEFDAMFGQFTSDIDKVAAHQKAQVSEPEGWVGEDGGYIPDPRDEEPWSDTQTRIEQMNSIKGR